MNSNQRIKVDELNGYFLDHKGKLCYQDKNGDWFYCKKVENKPGFVWIYSYGKKIECNEVSYAIKYIKDYKKFKPITKKKEPEVRETDGRYKDNVDKGYMSYLNIPLPLKPTEEKKILDDTPKQYIRLREAKRRRKKK